MKFDAIRHLFRALNELEIEQLVRRHGGLEDGVSLDDVGLREVAERVISERQWED